MRTLRQARPSRKMTLRGTFISVWRQSLADGQSEVQLGGQRYRVGFTQDKHLRTVAFRHGQRQFFGIEQNPRTRSRWAMLAREGKRVMQFRYRSQYIANVCEGTLFRYPAWRTLRLPK